MSVDSWSQNLYTDENNHWICEMNENSDLERRVFSKIADFMEGFKSLNDMLMRNVESVSRFETEFLKITRQNNQLMSNDLDFRSEFSVLRSDLSQFRADISRRLDFLLQRIDDLENGQDKIATEMHAVQVELRSHYNQILSANQDGIFNRQAISDLEDRVAELERRASL